MAVINERISKFQITKINLKYHMKMLLNVEFPCQEILAHFLLCDLGS